MSFWMPFCLGQDVTEVSREMQMQIPPKLLCCTC